MKKKLLFFILGVYLSLGAFAQIVSVPVTNYSFTNPVYTAKIKNGTGIPGWKWTIPVSDAGREAKSKRVVGDSLFAYVHSTEGKMYQVLNEKVGTSSVTYSLSYLAQNSYSNGKPTVMRSYFGVKNGGAITFIDSTDNVLGGWASAKHIYTLPLNSAFNGDSLVIAFANVVNPVTQGGWADIDSVTLTKEVVLDVVPVTNYSFTNPVYTAKIKNGTGIPGWNWTMPVSDAGREAKSKRVVGDSLFAYVHSTEGKMYQVLNEKVGTSSVTYSLNYLAQNSYSNGKPVVMRSYFGVKNGGAITFIDSTDNVLGGWARAKHNYTLPLNSAFNGDSLVIAFANVVNPVTQQGWADIDSVTITKIFALPKNLDSIAVSFANANDSLVVLQSGLCTPIFYPSSVANLKIKSWAVSDTTLATINDVGMLTAKTKIGKVKVTVTPLADTTKKGTVNIVIYKVKATSISVTLPDTMQVGAVTAAIATVLPANTTFPSVKWTVSDTIASIDPSSGVLTIKDILGYGADVTVTATSDSTSGISGSKKIHVKKVFMLAPLPIANAGFERPDDSRAHDFFTDSVPGWHTDDPTTAHQGRETSVKTGTNFVGHVGKYAAFSENNSISGVYQAVDKISSDSASYMLSYIAKADYVESTDTMYCVTYFSHFAHANGITTRTKIDSVVISLGTQSSGHPIVFINAPLKIHANAAYTGDSLVIEITQKTMNNGVRTGIVAYGSWMYFDQIALSKLKPVVHATSIGLKFENTDNTLGVGRSGIVNATVLPADVSYADVTWSVSDATIASIDAQGNLTGIKKGTVIVTATGKYDLTIKGTLSIQITSGLGISTVIPDNIKVYPNPSNGNFTLSAPAASEVSIFDVNGRLIYNTKTTLDKTLIDLSGSGVYMLQIKTKDGKILNKKVLVK